MRWVQPRLVPGSDKVSAGDEGNLLAKAVWREDGRMSLSEQLELLLALVQKKMPAAGSWVGGGRRAGISRSLSLGGVLA